MGCLRFTIAASHRKEVEHHLKTAHRLGHVRQVKYLLAILAVVDGQPLAQVALVLRVPEKTGATWGHVFCGSGLQGAPRHKPTGRPPQLPPPPQAALVTGIEEGPVKAGVSGACGRSPMIQQLLYDRFGVLYTGFSIAPLLKNLGWSSQQAAFVPEHLAEAKRHAWGTTTWPQLVRLAKERRALLLFGDESSCPQWGTLRQRDIPTSPPDG